MNFIVHNVSISFSSLLSYRVHCCIYIIHMFTDILPLISLSLNINIILFIICLEYLIILLEFLIVKYSSYNLYRG